MTSSVARSRISRRSGSISRCVAARVEPGARLVEHEHRRVLEQRARHRDAAALAAGERAAALADRRVRPSSSPSRPAARSAAATSASARLRPGVGDVVAHRARQQRRVLEQHRDVLADRGERERRAGRGRRAARLPAAGSAKRSTSLTSVDLPAPQAPTTATQRPRSSARSSPSSAGARRAGIGVATPSSSSRPRRRGERPRARRLLDRGLRVEHLDHPLGAGAASNTDDASCDRSRTGR